MSRLLPHPILTLGLLAMWLLLTSFTPGQFLLGLIVAIFAGWAMSALQPKRVVVHSWTAALRLFGVVFVDIVSSNLSFARAILFPDKSRIDGFIAIPLGLRNRTALATLALIINNTPGTAWLEYDSGSGVLLLHVFEYRGDAEWIDAITQRYEPLLKEIFE